MYIDIYGYKVLIDDEDFDRVSAFRWYVVSRWSAQHLREENPLIYFRCTKIKTVLHRFVIGAKKGEVVDHKNRNTLDNRKENLRITTTAMNAHNSKIYVTNKTGCPGVRRSGKKWRVEIRIDRKRTNLGSFETFDEAEKVYWKKKAEFLP